MAARMALGLALGLGSVSCLSAQLVADRVGARPVTLVPGGLPRGDERVQRAVELLLGAPGPWVQRAVGHLAVLSPTLPLR